MSKTLLICGTPGTGKTFICQALAKKMNIQNKKVEIINISELVIKEKLYFEFDDEIDSAIIDDKMLKRRLLKLVHDMKEKNDLVVLESHSVGCIPRNIIDYIIVLQVNTQVHYDRLSIRKYSSRKIDENIDCEIMQVVLEDVINYFPNITNVSLPNNTSSDANKILKHIEGILSM